VFTGRVVQPGDPEFLQADTDGAIALAEEEDATCPGCGQLKVWCRAVGNQFAFEVVEDQCHATHALEVHRAAMNKKRDDATRRAIHMYARLPSKAHPDLLAGLDLPTDEQDNDSD
jgi:hypothetical protein